MSESDTDVTTCHIGPVSERSNEGVFVGTKCQNFFTPDKLLHHTSCHPIPRLAASDVKGSIFADKKVVCHDWRHPERLPDVLYGKLYLLDDPDYLTSLVYGPSNL